MLKYTLTLSLIYLSGTFVVGQVTRVKGRIIDEDNQPVSYANIGIVDTQIGTASNEQGLFELMLTQAPEDGELSVSAISYKNFTFKLSEIPDPLNFTITLKHHYTQMNEVVVTALDENAHNIVRKALENRRKNYTRKPYQIKGFYRELLRNDNEYVSLVESAFTMDDKGYHKNDIKRFRLDALRKSDDLREMDSLDIYYENFLRNNDLASLFTGDYIDGQTRQWSYYFWPSFNESMLENFDFLLDSMVYFDNHLVYCISFFSKKYASHLLEYNQLFIRSLDYALIEMRVMSKPKEITKTQNDQKGNISYLIDGAYYKKVSIKYKAYQGHWYPHIITLHGNITGGDRQKSSRIAYENMRASGTDELDFTSAELNGRKLDPDKNNYYRFQQVLITNVSNNKDKYKKIKNAEMMVEDQYVRKYKMPYSPAFWKDYNKILMNPYLKAAQKQLQKARPLEQQFIDNGRGI